MFFYSVCMGSLLLHLKEVWPALEPKKCRFWSLRFMGWYVLLASPGVLCENIFVAVAVHPTICLSFSHWPDPGEMSQSLRGPFVHSCWGSFWHKARGSGRLPGPRNYAVPCCLSAITNGIYRSIHSICGNPELSWRFGGRRVMAVLSASWHIMLAHHGRWIRHKSEMAVPHNFRGFQSW